MLLQEAITPLNMAIDNKNSNSYAPYICLYMKPELAIDKY